TALNRASYLEDATSMEPRLAQSTARLEALAIGNSATSESSIFSAGLLSNAAGFGDVSKINPAQYENLEGPNFQSGDIKEKAETATESAKGLQPSSAGSGGSQAYQPAANLLDGSHISQQHAGNVNRVFDHTEQLESKHRM